jgi:hypothetical protein
MDPGGSIDVIDVPINFGIGAPDRYRYRCDLCGPLQIIFYTRELSFLTRQLAINLRAKCNRGYLRENRV